MNQFTNAQAAGIEPGSADYPQGANQFTAGTRQEHPEEVRAKIKAGNIVARLEKLVESEDTKPEHVIAAGKILLDKTVSSLSSIDQTLREETQSEEQLEAKLRMLLDKVMVDNPTLLSKLLGERARESGQPQPIDSEGLSDTG